MSQNAAPPLSRPPSSASSSRASPGQLARVHQHQPHDHTRPLPPPRLPLDTVASIVALGGSSSSGPASTIPPSPRPSAGPATSFRSASRSLVTVGQTTPTPASTAPSGSPSPRPGGGGGGGLPAPAEVSLEVPRPDGERIANEYVDAPFRPAPKPGRPDSQLKPSNHQRSCPNKAAKQHASAGKTGPRPGCPRRGQAASQQRPGHGAHQLLGCRGRGPEARPGPEEEDARRTGSARSATITKQPVSFTKEPCGGNGGPAALGGAGLDVAGNDISIVCSQCHRCKCASCREPPALPSRWLCHNACFCSPETAVDYASCVCCVKGLFYHCADSGNGIGSLGASASLDPDDVGGSCADEPCSCAGSRKTARWTCLGALALVLPCLLCYWPLRGCLYMCESYYSKRTVEGCMCEHPRSAPGPGGAFAQARQALTAEAHLTAGEADPSSPRSQLSEALMRDSRDPEKRLLDPLGSELL